MRSIVILHKRPSAVIQGSSRDPYWIFARVSDQGEGEREFLVMSLDVDRHNSSIERAYPQLKAKTNRTMPHSDASL